MFSCSRPPLENPIKLCAIDFSAVNQIFPFKEGKFCQSASKITEASKGFSPVFYV